MENKENITGIELGKTFVDVGFELFEDRDQIEQNFVYHLQAMRSNLQEMSSKP